MLGSVLLVEDNEDDAVFAEKVFRDCRVLNPFRWVRGGTELKEYLEGQGKYGCREAFPLPTLLLLDLKLPQFSGHEILIWLGQVSSSPKCRVIVLTELSDFRDLNRAYQ